MLVFNSTNENKELLKKYNDVFNGIRNKIKKVSSDEYDYEKNYMKIKFNSDDDLPLKKQLKFYNMAITSDDDLPLKKQLKFYNMAITVRPVFEEDGKLYPQVFLDATLYELNI